MNKRFITIQIVLLTLVITSATAQPSTDGNLDHTQQVLDNRTAVFIENRGQWDARAKFLLRSPGLDLWIMANGVVYDLYRMEPATTTKQNEAAVRRGMTCHVPEPATDAEPAKVTRKAVSMSFVGALPDAEARGTEQLEGYHNYFIGNDPAKWATKVPLYAGASLEHVYDGIDAVFYLEDGRPRYDLIVAPGADPAQVKMKFDGADRVSVDGDGSVVIHTELGDVRQRELFAYQVIDGRKRQVRCRFVKKGSVVEFDIGRYDRTQPLVIDPLIYSTYLGGSDDDQAFSIAVDDSRNAYVTGYTSSTDFPTSNAYQSLSAGRYDAFVTKLSRSGNLLIYSTYLGGSDRDDKGNGIAIDKSGNVYVTGFTYSSNFPTANAYQPSLAGRIENGDKDVFVTKLGSAGNSLSYSTYFGGSSGDQGNAIAVNGNGNAYVTGYTSSTNFPTFNAYQSLFGGSGINDDAFVTKFSTNGNTLVYSTYLGGSSGDQGNAIAVDGNGNAYVTGTTISFNFPTSDAYQPSKAGGVDDAFVTKLNSDGSALSYSTYLGGNEFDRGFGIAVDIDNNVYVAGWTSSSNFPTANAYQPSYASRNDAFVTKLDSSGRSLVYSTYLGGDRHDYAQGIAVDADYNVYVAGWTSSSNFPTANAYQASFADYEDAFVTKFSSDGSSLVYSTYLGGNELDYAYGIVLDIDGNAYVTGRTGSFTFPTLQAYQSSNAGGSYDTFVTKLSSPQSAGVDASELPSQSSLVLHPLQPNPITNNTLQLGFSLAEPANVTVEVYGIDGRLFSKPINERLYEAGERSEQLAVGDIPSGAYLLRLRAGKHEQTEQFVVVH